MEIGGNQGAILGDDFRDASSCRVLTLLSSNGVPLIASNAK